MTDKQRYLGMDIHAALAAAAAAGEQLRVLNYGDRVMRYAEDPGPTHIQVHVKNEHITRVL